MTREYVRAPFAVLLRQWRVQAGLTQEELADLANLSREAISALERGTRRSPQRETVRRLAAALSLSEADRSELEEAARAAPLPASAPLPNEVPPHGLLGDLTPLIGRERDEAQAVHLLLSPTVRMLTLTGPGGVGKTRLAARVAETAASAFGDGLQVVPLATIGSPSQVPAAVARALGAREGPGTASEKAVIRRLRDRRLLLLLDNFEHLLDATPFVVRLLVDAQGVKALITSREPLRARGEQQLDVPPLDVPVLRASIPSEQLARYSAVSLFLERARAVRSNFRPSPGELLAVAEICRRLDGLPLAIELAAARVKVLSPRALLDRLEHPLEILTDGAADAPRRQQTMRGAIAWSYGLLSEGEQAMMRRVAVFVGGFDVPAVEAVCDDLHGGRLAILGRLTSLVNKNLLVVSTDASGEPRFRMLEVIREYATERLIEVGEADEMGRRHAEYCQRLAKQAESALWGEQQTSWFRRLDADEGNLRAALEWAVAHGDAPLALAIGGALWRFWIWHGDYGGWRQLLDRALSLGDDAASALRAKALWAVGWLAQHQGDYAGAHAYGEENLALSRELDDPLAVRHALNGLGMALRGRGETQRAVELFSEAVEIARTLRERQFLAPSLFNLGLATAEIGEDDRAIQIIGDALTLFREQGEKYIATAAARSLAYLLLSRGEYSRAVPLCRESLLISEETQQRSGILDSLEAVGALCSVAGRAEAAVRIFSAANALRAGWGQLPPPQSRMDSAPFGAALEPYVDAATTQLDTSIRQAAEAEGGQMSPAQAVALALQELDGISGEEATP